MSVSATDDSIRPEVLHVIWKPHKTQQSMGRSTKCLKAGQLCDISG
jgi:hypothetical protein